MRGFSGCRLPFDGAAFAHNPGITWIGHATRLVRSVAVYRGTVAAGILSWGPPQIAAAATDATVTPQDFLDKDYIACDPSTGALYVAYTRFIGGFQPRRSAPRRTGTFPRAWARPGRS